MHKYLIVVFRISSGVSGRTWKGFWKLSDSTDVITIYKQGQILMAEVNAYMSIIIPSCSCLLIAVITLMSFNTVRLYHTTPLVAFAFYPLTAIFTAIVAILVGKTGQKMYDSTAGTLENLNQDVAKQCQSVTTNSKQRQILRSLAPFGVKVGPFYMMKNGFTQSSAAFTLDQLINLLVSY